MTNPSPDDNRPEPAGSRRIRTPASRRLSHRSAGTGQKGRKSYLMIIAAAVALAALVAARIVFVWGQRDPAQANIRYPLLDVPQDDPGVVEAVTLYTECLELMSHRRFDEATPVVEKARSAHIRLMERFPLHQYPQMKWIEAQERQLANYERLLSERETARELRAMALASQRRTRQANLEKTIARAEALKESGNPEKAVKILTSFAEQHESYEVAGEALRWVEEIRRETRSGAD